MLTQTPAMKRTFIIAAAAIVTGIVALSSTAQSNVAMIAKGDRLEIASHNIAASPCADQAWPNYDRSCMAWINAKANKEAPRLVTIEKRDVANRTSTLTRLPITQVAVQ